VVYGVLVLVACLPGAVVLLVEARRRAVDPVVDVTTPASVTTIVLVVAWLRRA
jgi:hypothetical protein